jgi:hypothetical protein
METGESGPDRWHASKHGNCCRTSRRACPSPHACTSGIATPLSDGHLDGLDIWDSLPGFSREGSPRNTVMTSGLPRFSLDYRSVVMCARPTSASRLPGVWDVVISDDGLLSVGHQSITMCRTYETCGHLERYCPCSCHAAMLWSPFYLLEPALAQPFLNHLFTATFETGLESAVCSNRQGVMSVRGQAPGERTQDAPPRCDS